MFLCVRYATVACTRSLLHVNSCVAMLRLLCELYVAMQRPIKIVTLLSNGKARGKKNVCTNKNKRQTRHPGRYDAYKTQKHKCHGRKHVVRSPRRGSKTRPNVWLTGCNKTPPPLPPPGASHRPNADQDSRAKSLLLPCYSYLSSCSFFLNKS